MSVRNSILLILYLAASAGAGAQSLNFSQALILRSSGVNPSHQVPAGKVWKLENFHTDYPSNYWYFNVSSDSTYSSSNNVQPYQQCNGCSAPTVDNSTFHNAYWIPAGWYLRGGSTNSSVRYTFFILEFNVVP